MKQVFFSLTLLAVAAICNAQANTQLSNLASPTKVSQSLIPGGTTGTKDLGSNTKRWRNGYFNATVYGYGVGSSYGVYGTSATYGVRGVGGTYGVFGSGTYGTYGSGTSYGVYGTASGGYGVAGISSSSYGLYGSSSSSWGSVAYGVYGAFGSGTTGYGVQGVSNSSYGVYGTSGYLGVYGVGDTYGVYGYSSSGNGVYAYSSNSNGIWAYAASSATTGIYAGVFESKVYSYGGYFQSSDRNLKKNIKDVSNAMSIINQLKPKNYEFRDDAELASLHMPKGTHYGLIAQELELVLPDLVNDGPVILNNSGEPTKLDGKPGSQKQEDQLTKSSNVQKEGMRFKGVNYDELIPIIIKGMQELSKQNDDLKTQVATLTQTVSQLSKSNGTISANSASINQNFPNPFTKSTVISFNVPQGSNANLVVSQTGSGKVMKTIALSSGSSQLNFDGASLAAGSYTYSLVIDGKKVDSKQMIISR
jgi:hypothetical protein